MENVIITTPYITTPNYIGKILRETPKMYIVELTEKTFNKKQNNRFSHTFTNDVIKYHKEGFTPKIKRFWKKNNQEVNGTNKIIINL
jgi:hypothetical protein